MTTVPKTKPRSKRIDLKKADGCNHPDITERGRYRVKIYGQWHVGTFSRQWYGWSFDNWGTSGIQLDSIQEVWKV